MRVIGTPRISAHWPLLFLMAALLASSVSTGQELATKEVSLRVDAQQGIYGVAFPNGPTIVRARSGAEVDHRWLRSTDYPRHATRESSFTDALGAGTELIVTCSGLPDAPDLIYSLRNTTAREVRVEALRAVEALGEDILELRGPAAADRVLSDSFSEDWPPLKIYDLGAAPAGMHRAVGSQLIYNRESGQSFFVGALTSDRFLTVIHLQADVSGAPKVAAFSVDSTGTTEIQHDFDLKNA